MVSISKVRAVLFGTLYHWFVASERQLTRPYPSFGQSPAAPHTSPTHPPLLLPQPNRKSNLAELDLLRSIFELLKSDPTQQV